VVRVDRLVILTHQQQGLDPDYFLGRMKRLVWEREGREVLVHQGTRRPPAAEVAILHIDLTTVPDEYLELARSYPRCVNAGVADISKRRVSRWLVTAEDAYDGPVIVKSNFNHSGDPEWRLRRAQGGLGTRLHQVALRWLPPAWGGRFSGYQLFHRKGQVPAWVWRRGDLVVERFFVEPRGALFALRQWHFFADRGHVSTILSSTPLVKWENKVALAPIDHDVPEEVWQLRRELGFGFGKFDYVVDQGRPVVFDTNPTPHFGSDVLRERNLWIIANLASGLDSLAEGRG
jgi:hypothetical protein